MHTASLSGQAGLAADAGDLPAATVAAASSPHSCCLDEKAPPCSQRGFKMHSRLCLITIWQRPGQVKPWHHTSTLQAERVQLCPQNITVIHGKDGAPFSRTGLQSVFPVQGFKGLHLWKHCTQANPGSAGNAVLPVGAWELQSVWYSGNCLCVCHQAISFPTAGLKILKQQYGQQGLCRGKGQA